MTDWDELTHGSEHERDAHVACTEPHAEYSAEQRAAIADPQAGMHRLSERIALRCDYEKRDKETDQVAYRLMQLCGDVEPILRAYDRLEKSDANGESWWVRTARKWNPNWQVAAIVAEFKRDGVADRRQVGSIVKQVAAGTYHEPAQRSASWLVTLRDTGAVNRE